MIFHISELNDLKVMHRLYAQYLIKTLSKTTFFLQTGGNSYDPHPGYVPFWPRFLANS
jgi:hypothetical protein